MSNNESVSSLLKDQEVTPKDELSERLQEELMKERDKRREDRFFGIVILVVIFDIVFFSVMPSFGGPLALLILELLILIPVARRLGMERIAEIIDRVLGRLASEAGRES